MPGVSRRGVAARSSTHSAGRPVRATAGHSGSPLSLSPLAGCSSVASTGRPAPRGSGVGLSAPPAKAGPEPGTESPRGVSRGATERAVPRSQGGSKLPLWVRGEMTAESRVSEGEELATCAPRTTGKGPSEDEPGASTAAPRVRGPAPNRQRG